MKRIYLDYAATTPTHPDVVGVMAPYLTDAFGNPSSIHFYGQEARRAIEESRTQVAKLIGALSNEIIFTSGGTEANNLAIKGTALSNEGRSSHIITSSIEHHSVLEVCKFLEKRGFSITYLPVDKYGLVDPDDVKKAISKETILISIILASNEVGTIEPVIRISEIAREMGVRFHTDAVQAVGHIPIDVKTLGVDFLSMSSHKLYGPKGVGALYIKNGAEVTPLIHGGAQEGNQRSGTENVPGVVGFGKAAEIALMGIDEEIKYLTDLRDRFVSNITKRLDGIKVNGHPDKRLPNNINLSVSNVEGEAIILNLDLKGICASTGSACSSSSIKPSHVLLSMGFSAEEANSSIRFTLGKQTTEKEIEYAIDVLSSIVRKLRDLQHYER